MPWHHLHNDLQLAATTNRRAESEKIKSSGRLFGKNSINSRHATAAGVFDLVSSLGLKDDLIARGRWSPLDR